MVTLYLRCAAKFLWKRIPESIKKEHTELKKIWDIGVALWNQNFSAAYNALNQEWSESVKTIMQAVKGDDFFPQIICVISRNFYNYFILIKIRHFFPIEKTRLRFVTLVSQAYTSISLADFAKYVGLSELEAGKLAAEQPGWTYDTENRVIRPVKAEVKETETIPSEQQLHLLTDFVAFLEK